MISHLYNTSFFRKWHKYDNALVIAILVVGITLAEICAWQAYQSSRNAIRQQFDHACDAATNLIIERAKIYSFGLRGARGLFIANPAITRDGFIDYLASRDMATEFPGIRGVGYIQRVRKSDSATFTENTRTLDNLPDFSIRTKDQAFDELYVIRFIEPLQLNHAALGYDIGSEPIRREAAERAMLTGEPTITGRITLVQDPKGRPGLLYLLPVYRGRDPGTPELRRKQLVGWVYAPIVIEDMVAAAVATTERQVNLAVFDGSGELPEQSVFASDQAHFGKTIAQLKSQLSDPELSRETQITVAGRQWTLLISSSAEFGAATNPVYPFYIGGGGAFVTVLVALLVNTAKRAYTRSVELANSMTAELQQTNGLRRAILDSANYSIISTDTQGTIVSINQTACQWLGYSADELVGRVTPALIHEGSEMESVARELSARFGREIEPGFGVFTAIPDRGEVDEREWTYIRKDGSRFPVSLSITAVRDVSGTVVGYLGVATDLTQRKIIDSQLRRVTQAMENAVEGISQLGPDGRYTNVNAAYAARTGYTPKELIGMEWSKTVYPDDLPIVLAAYNAMVENGKGEAGVRGLQKNGTVFHKQVTMVAIRGVDGKFEGNFCFMKDVSERKQSEEALRRSQILLSSVLNHALDGVLATKAIREDGQIVDFEFRLANPAAERLVGKSASELIGGRMLEQFPDSAKTGLFDQYVSVVETGVPYIGDQHFGTGGHSRWFRIAAVPLDDGLAITMGDITAQKLADATNRQYTAELLRARDAMAKQAEELKIKSDQLDIARIAAEEASQAKSNFLANMSHEIRTPMAAILGYSDLMLDPNQGSNARQNAIKVIHRNGQHLLEVINDILDLTKIEAGRMFVERILCDLPRIAAEAASMTRPKAMEKGLSLKLEFTTPIPRTGLTDPLRLRQVLVNLIGNAIKFTPAGSVIVRVSCDEPSKSDTSIRFQVVDTGVGMSGTEIQGLFRPFTQADVSTTRRFGGTGLGLTISRQFARMLGGDISVQSEPGKGSTFTFETKVGPVAAENLVEGLTESGIENSQITGSADMAHRLDGVSVLLAEDGIDNREILTAYLRGAGALVETVENGQDAVRVALESLRNGKPFTVILMDMQMPVQDGYNATSELRRNGYDRPIIALTAHAMADDRAKCLAAGCNDYLSKPVERTVLVNSILQNLDPSELPASGYKPPLPSHSAASTVTDAGVPGVIRSDLADDADFRSVLASFVGRLPVIVGELTTFTKSRDMAGLTQSLHQLKGAGGSYGFGMLSQLAGAAEAKLLSGESIDTVDPQVAELVAYIQRIEGFDATSPIDAAA